MVKFMLSGIYKSELLSGLPIVAHGFSGRDFGDMRLLVNQKRLFERLDLDWRQAVIPIQVHGNSIAELGTDHIPGKQLKSDGLLYDSSISLNNIPVLCVLSADCVPVLLADPIRKIIGAVHAGWRGALLGIPGKAIDMMISRGSKAENIRVAIGPYIKSCCYAVSGERAGHFIDKYSDQPSIVINRQKKWYIDIGNAIIKDIRHWGIKDENIDTSEFCTACNSDKFFSFRKDDPKKSGMNLHFISLNIYDEYFKR